MGFMTIDGRKVEFTDEKNVLSVIRNAGIICLHCAIIQKYPPSVPVAWCTVEDDRGRTFASCSEVPRDGMVIYTNSGRIKKYRKLIVELLLSAHCRDCTHLCKKRRMCAPGSGSQNEYHHSPFPEHREIRPLDTSSPALVRDPNKCILCGDCVRACSEIQGLGI